MFEGNSGLWRTGSYGRLRCQWVKVDCVSFCSDPAVRCNIMESVLNSIVSLVSHIIAHISMTIVFLLKPWLLLARVAKYRPNACTLVFTKFKGIFFGQQPSTLHSCLKPIFHLIGKLP